MFNINDVWGNCQTCKRAKLSYQNINRLKYITFVSGLSTLLICVAFIILSLTLDMEYQEKRLFNSFEIFGVTILLFGPVCIYLGFICIVLSIFQFCNCKLLDWK